MLKAETTGVPVRFQGCGFKNFEQNKGNRELFQECFDFALGKTKKNSLVMFGRVGTGKTHLSIAVMKNLSPIERETRLRTKFDGEVEEKYAKIITPARSVFLPVDEFFQELNDAAVNRESKQKVIDRYLNDYDLVVLDDLGIFNWTNAKQENLYLFINRAYLDNKRIIITTNFTPEELEQKDERITSRLKEMALFLQFEGKDYRK